MKNKKTKKPVIISGPSAEELRPTEKEQKHLQQLLDWEKRSMERDWPVGLPYEY